MGMIHTVHIFSVGRLKSIYRETLRKENKKKTRPPDHRRKAKKSERATLSHSVQTRSKCSIFFLLLFIFSFFFFSCAVRGSRCRWLTHTVCVYMYFRCYCSFTDNEQTMKRIQATALGCYCWLWQT